MKDNEKEQKDLQRADIYLTKRYSKFEENIVIYEIKPVKFGGSPEDMSNKIFITHEEHMKYVIWWNNVFKEIMLEKMKGKSSNE